MLYDKKGLNVIRAASKEPSRFAINGLQLAPGGETAATDGKLLIVLSPCDGKPKEYPDVGGHPRLPKGGMIVDPDTVAEIQKRIPKKANKDILKHAALTVADSKKQKLEFTTTDGTKTRRLGNDAMEGTFPKYKEVLAPLYDRKMLVYRFGADLLKKLAEIGLSTVCDEDTRIIEFHLDVEDPEGRPALIRARNGDGRFLVGALMPMKSRGAAFDLTKWERKFLKVKALGKVNAEASGNAKKPRAKK